MPRYGYLSLDYCERVVENYTLSGIPLETFVTDTPYMDQYQDFTVSSDYPLDKFQAFIKKLHSANQRWVMPPNDASPRLPVVASSPTKFWHKVSYMCRYQY